MSVPILKSSTKTQVEYYTFKTPVICPNFAIGAKGAGIDFRSAETEFISQRTEELR